MHSYILGMSSHGYNHKDNPSENNEGEHYYIFIENSSGVETLEQKKNFVHEYTLPHTMSLFIPHIRAGAVVTFARADSPYLQFNQEQQSEGESDSDITPNEDEGIDTEHKHPNNPINSQSLGDRIRGSAADIRDEIISRMYQ